MVEQLLAAAEKRRKVMPNAILCPRRSRASDKCFFAPQRKSGRQTEFFRSPRRKAAFKQKFFARSDAGRLSNRNFFARPNTKSGFKQKFFASPEAKSSLKQKFCGRPSGISPKTPAATPVLCSCAGLPVPTRSRQPHILRTAWATALALRPDGTRSPLCPPSAAAFRRAGQ